MSDEPKFCYLCKDAGRNLPAHRTMPNGKGVCRFHFEGALIPAGTTVLEILEEKTQVKTQEEIMPKKIEIDLDKLKQLHGQGATDGAIGKVLGCCTSVVARRRGELGLKPNANRGRPPSGNGSKSRGAARPRMAKRMPAGNGADRVTLSVDEVFLDGVWAGLRLVQKAQLVNRLCEG